MAVTALRVMSRCALRTLLHTLRGCFYLSAEITKKAVRCLRDLHVVLTARMMRQLLMLTDRRRTPGDHTVRILQLSHLAIRVFPLVRKIRGAQPLHALVVSTIDLRPRRPLLYAQNPIILRSIHNLFLCSVCNCKLFIIISYSRAKRNCLLLAIWISFYYNESTFG